MTAKIKARNPYGRDSHRHKPRGLSNKAFEQVYWPFIPILVGIMLMLPFAIKSDVMKQPLGRVLSYQATQDAQSLLASTNQQRSAANQASLTLNSRLSAAATRKAQDMASRGYWSHNTPEGNPPWSFVTDTGYQYMKLGENLAAGFGNDSDVVRAWMASPLHRDNILDPLYQEVGFGYANISDYRAIGGGPMTIVVAYYGAPTTTVATASTPTITLPSSASPSSPSGGQALAGQTTKAQLVTASAQINTWFPLIILLGTIGISIIWAIHHISAIKRAGRSSKRYLYKHPMMDIGFIVFVGLVLLLVQTAGYIQ